MGWHSQIALCAQQPKKVDRNAGLSEDTKILIWSPTPNEPIQEPTPKHDILALRPSRIPVQSLMAAFPAWHRLPVLAYPAHPSIACDNFALSAIIRYMQASLRWRPHANVSDDDNDAWKAEIAHGVEIRTRGQETAGSLNAQSDPLVTPDLGPDELRILRVLDWGVVAESEGLHSFEVLVKKLKRERTESRDEGTLLKELLCLTGIATPSSVSSMPSSLQYNGIEESRVGSLEALQGLTDPREVKGFEGFITQSLPEHGVSIDDLFGLIAAWYPLPQSVTSQSLTLHAEISRNHTPDLGSKQDDSPTPDLDSSVQTLTFSKLPIRKTVGASLISSPLEYRKYDRLNAEQEADKQQTVSENDPAAYPRPLRRKHAMANIRDADASLMRPGSSASV